MSSSDTSTTDYIRNIRNQPFELPGYDTTTSGESGSSGAHPVPEKVISDHETELKTAVEETEEPPHPGHSGDVTAEDTDIDDWDASDTGTESEAGSILEIEPKPKEITTIGSYLKKKQPPPLQSRKSKSQPHEFVLPTMLLLTRALLEKKRIQHQEKVQHRQLYVLPKMEAKRVVVSSDDPRCKYCNCICSKSKKKKPSKPGPPGNPPRDPNADLPGPADYSPNYALLQSYHGTARITERIKIKDQAQPGPAFANLHNLDCATCNRSFAKARRFPCKGRSTFGPGPSKYNLQNFQGVSQGCNKGPTLKARPKTQQTFFSNLPLEDVSGMTRFGPSKSPAPIFMSRPRDPIKDVPGPGTYRSQNDEYLRRKKGIYLKPKAKMTKPRHMVSFPPMKLYNLPPLPRGPQFSIGQRTYKDTLINDSPGPIYYVGKYQSCRSMPVSMTFKPFPENVPDTPGPFDFPEAGKQALKVRPRSPAAILIGRHQN